MTLTIEIAPDVENRLRVLATRTGLPVEEYVKALVEREALEKAPEAKRPLYETLTPDEWADAFLVWARGHRTDTPVVPLEALRRENLYEDY